MGSAGATFQVIRFHDEKMVLGVRSKVHLTEYRWCQYLAWDA